MTYRTHRRRGDRVITARPDPRTARHRAKVALARIAREYPLRDQ